MWSEQDISTGLVPWGALEQRFVPPFDAPWGAGLCFPMALPSDCWMGCGGNVWGCITSPVISAKGKSSEKGKYLYPFTPMLWPHHPSTASRGFWQVTLSGKSYKRRVTYLLQLVLKSWLMLALPFPLASTSAQCGWGNTGPYPYRVWALITRQGCCTWPLTVMIGHGSTKKSQGITWCKHTSPYYCHMQQSYFPMMIRVNYSFLYLLSSSGMKWGTESDKAAATA